MTSRNVTPADLIRIECASAAIPGYELYFEPRRWHILTTRAALERAESSQRSIIRIPTYQPDGEKTLSMLSRLTPGLREAWERKHGSGIVHLNYIHNARTGLGIHGCQCSQCTDPETITAQLTA
jgi:hypothetical protein